MKPIFRRVLPLILTLGFLGAAGAQSSLPDAPTHLKAKKNKDGTIALIWAPSSTSTIAGYNIYLYSGDHYHRVNGQPVQGTRYVIQQKMTGTLDLVVRAMASTTPPFESLNSNQVRVRMGKK